LKDLANLGSELNRLKNDQKKSKSHFERMKMYLKKKSTKKKIISPPESCSNGNEGGINLEDKSGCFSDESDENIYTLMGGPCARNQITSKTSKRKG
jgi:hypothetical protein